MKKDVIKSLFESYQPSMGIEPLLDLIEEQMKVFKPLLVERTVQSTPEGQKDLVVKLPIIRLSEKMWGKEGTADREIIQNLLQRVVEGGGSLRDRIIKVANFVTTPPQTKDISEILTYVVLLDTLTNIMLHFNASAAGFTFEGFLAALLRGTQIPAGGQSGIQDIIDNDKSPISLKLLTEEGSASVEGSYRDLCDHFIDPGGLKQDPTSREYVGQAGEEGSMTYVVALKSFREKGAEEALTSKDAASIHFYQFDFNAANFLDAMRSNPHNATLLLLPSDINQEAPPEEGDATHISTGGEELDPEAFVRMFYGDDYNLLLTAQKKYLVNIAKIYDAEYAKELFAALDIVPQPTGKKATLKWNENAPDNAQAGTGMRGPSMGTRQPKDWEPLRGDERRKSVGKVSREQYLDAKTSIKMLEDALAEGPKNFWALISRTLGYSGVGGHTQFDINRAYYENRSYNKHGLGYIGTIPVGKAAVTELAQNYVDVLNQQIFDLFEKVELLANQINGYFIGGNKEQGLAAADTAKEIEGTQREYVSAQGQESPEAEQFAQQNLTSD